MNAKGFFYEKDLKDYRNLMDGDRLDLYFNKGKMDKAVVSGKAQSTYFYVKKDRTVSGKNEAAGDTIHITFDAQKNAVKSLRLLGGGTMASGRYIDLEKERRKKMEAKLDSIQKNVNLPAKQDSLKKSAAKASGVSEKSKPKPAPKLFNSVNQKMLKRKEENNKQQEKSAKTEAKP